MRSQKVKFLSFSALVLACAPLGAAEVDQYTQSYQQIVDSAPIINERANRYLKEALVKANQAAGCNEKVLYENLRHYFANHSKGQLCMDLLHDESIPKIVTPLDQSVYRDWSPLNGFLLGRKKARTSPLALGPIVRMGKSVVGTDKFEHMFGMGFQYFTKHHLKGKDLESVLRYGIFMEKTALGGNILATGVFSYADLSANFNGMRFWNHMLQQHDDVLGPQHNIGPYISCQNGKWQAARKIDFRKYMDLTMDESVNCSKFAARKGLAKITNRIAEVRQNSRINRHRCLDASENNDQLLSKYEVVIETDRKKRPISNWIINQQGHGKVSYFAEFD